MKGKISGLLYFLLAWSLMSWPVAMWFSRAGVPMNASSIFRLYFTAFGPTAAIWILVRNRGR